MKTPCSEMVEPRLREYKPYSLRPVLDGAIYKSEDQTLETDVIGFLGLMYVIDRGKISIPASLEPNIAHAELFVGPLGPDSKKVFSMFGQPNKLDGITLEPCPGINEWTHYQYRLTASGLERYLRVYKNDLEVMRFAQDCADHFAKSLAVAKKVVTLSTR